MYHTAEAKIFGFNTGLDTSENVHAEKKTSSCLCLWLYCENELKETFEYSLHQIVVMVWFQHVKANFPSL